MLGKKFGEIRWRKVEQRSEKEVMFIALLARRTRNHAPTLVRMKIQNFIFSHLIQKLVVDGRTSYKGIGQASIPTNSRGHTCVPNILSQAAIQRGFLALYNPIAFLNNLQGPTLATGYNILLL